MDSIKIFKDGIKRYIISAIDFKSKMDDFNCDMMNYLLWINIQKPYSSLNNLPPIKYLLFPPSPLSTLSPFISPIYYGILQNIE